MGLAIVTRETHPLSGSLIQTSNLDISQKLEKKPCIMTGSESVLPPTVAYVNVQLLNGGSMTAEYRKLHAGEPAQKFRMYNWSFLVHHAMQDRWLLWDLGMSSVRL